MVYRLFDFLTGMLLVILPNGHFTGVKHNFGLAFVDIELVFLLSGQREGRAILHMNDELVIFQLDIGGHVPKKK